MTAAISISMTDEPKRAAFGRLFSAEEYADIDRQRARLRAEAVSWLSDRFSGVREEEVGDRIAETVNTIKRWERECESCADPKLCKHSRHMLDIGERYRGGFREFVIFARPCNDGIIHIEDARRHAEFEQSGIPAERRNNTFDNFDIRGAGMALCAAKGIAMDCASRGRGLIIGGPVGCGKTHLAIAMGLSALKDGRKVRFSLLPELLEQLKNEMLDGNSALYEEVKRCDLLILDDAGTAKETGWKDERLFMLIDWRYSHKLQTVITTNAASMDGLRELIKGERAERIFSRLTEMTEQVWLEGAPDYRRRGGERR